MGDRQWITINNRLKEGIALINNLNTKKFQLLLSHIINSPTDDYFTDSERQKLLETLKLDQNQLQLLLQSIAYIYNQSQRVILKPTDLQKQLLDVVGFRQEKAEIFTSEWSEEAKKELGDFEKRGKLVDMQWELNLQVENDLGSKLAVPSARIELDLAKASNEKEDKVILELGEDDLQQLYNTLEVIQLKLDNISKT
ncbi:COMM domain-containing protein 10 [Euwallacea similis]|uniref:COMM domain-containing protein 10 n=1 Tax=Euwallacea similis TaxID=1736056 RepID=UPI00344DE837